jgi:hypothetical protein
VGGTTAEKIIGQVIDEVTDRYDLIYYLVEKMNKA